jgi:glucokinase
MQNVSGNTIRILDDPATLPLVVGVDLGGTQIRTAVLRGPALLARVSMLTGDDSSPQSVIPRMVNAVHQVLADVHISIEDIAGIGIGAPGPLNGRTGVVFSPPNLLNWENVPLRDLFAQVFGVPVFVENDANVGALGEYMFGAGRGTQEMVYLTVSTGIGGGIISNGQLVVGATGMAGELGHMSVDMHGPLCNCGSVGCLEVIASGTAIARRASELIEQGKAEDLQAYILAHQTSDQEADTPTDRARASRERVRVNAQMVAQAAEAGVVDAQEIIAVAARALGLGLVNIIHIFNPERIILGGGVVQMGSLLLDPAQELVDRHTMPMPRAAVKIVKAELGSDVGLVGAGALLYYHR